MLTCKWHGATELTETIDEYMVWWRRHVADVEEL